MPTNEQRTLVAPHETLGFRHPAIAERHRRHLTQLRERRPDDGILDAQIFLIETIMEAGEISIEFAEELFLQERRSTGIPEQTLADNLSAAWCILGAVARSPVEQRSVPCSRVTQAARRQFRTGLFTRYSGETLTGRTARAVGLIMLDMVNCSEELTLTDLEMRIFDQWGPTEISASNYYGSLIQAVIYDLWVRLLHLIES